MSQGAKQSLDGSHAVYVLHTCIIAIRHKYHGDISVKRFQAVISQLESAHDNRIKENTQVIKVREVCGSV